MAEINLVIQNTPPIDIQIVDTPPIEVTMISTGAKGAKGDKGDKGDTGASIITAGFTDNDITFIKDDSNTVVLPNAKIELKGDQGNPGNEIELQKTSTHIQWRYTGGVWTDLIAISELIGPQGNPGDEVELQKTSTHIQWRLDGGEWTNLIAISEITGPQGEPGTSGIPGGVENNIVIINNNEQITDSGKTIPTGNVVGDSDTQTLTNKTLTSPTLAGTPVLDSTSAVPFYGDSLHRQAIINGNFDVWQRGVSSTTAGGSYYTADRWFRYDSPGTGTLPTITTSRQQIGVGLIPNSFYNLRMAYAGASANLSAGAENSLGYKIEFGTRYLCGLNKKVTVSFWAKSDIANKKLGLWASQKYGTGGSPTADENINGETFSLTSSWQKFTHTFTTNTLVGKTFGTANDDYLQLVFMGAWGSAFNDRNGTASVEDISGAGYIDIAQVQLCAGEVALPFMPKSYAQELLDCQRYYWKSFIPSQAPMQNPESTTAGAIQYRTIIAGLFVHSVYVPFPVSMRTVTPTITFYNPNNTNANWRNTFTGADSGAGAVDLLSDRGFGVRNPGVAGDGAQQLCVIHATADAEL